MRRWLDAAVPALREVADRPATWLVGGLAWAVTAGPGALLASVVPAPSVADLTHVAARTFSSGAWPWNAIGVLALASGAVLLALLLVAVSDTALLDGAVTAERVRAAYAVTLIGALPVLVPLGAAVVSVARVAPAEFTAPDSGGAGPVLRTIGLVWPLALLTATGAALGAAWGARARAFAVARGASTAEASAAALRAGPATPSLIHVVAAAATWTAYLLLAVILLGVLWAPIGARLAADAGFGAAEAALLVGFVAIWLCLVLGGGALHAWGVATWGRILALHAPPVGRARTHPQETPSTP